MITAVDLFCGVGGLTHGLERAGVDVAAGVDVDQECKYPFEANNAARFIQRDIRDLSGADVRACWDVGSTSLLAGCAPCQSFSTYSRRGRDIRSDVKWELVSEFGRLVHEAKPDLVTMENVPQLMEHRVFGELMTTLQDYHAWKGVIDCARYGVPQTRRRLVLLASRFGPIALIRPQGADADSPATVRRAISHLRPVAAGYADSIDALHRASSLSELNARRIKASRPGGSWREWDDELVAGCHRKGSGKTYPSVYGRMEWDAPAPTITTQSFGYGNGRFGHPEQDRAITLREAAILQTFPDSYRFLRDGERARFNILGRHIGNAVPVRIGELVARSLQTHLDGLGIESAARAELNT
jgi:DNA (cytosine-5)-methyltransferase 1